MKKRQIIWLIIALTINLFIFSQSLLTGSISSAQSGFFTTPIYNFLIKMNFNVERETVSLVVRKLAHFSEFFALGFAWFMFYKSFWQAHELYIKTFRHGFIVALIDEIIQYFTPERGSAALDVLIDSLGVLSFLLLAYLVTLIISKSEKRKKALEVEIKS